MRGDACLTSSVSLSITMVNGKGLGADVLVQSSPLQGQRKLGADTAAAPPVGRRWHCLLPCLCQLYQQLAFRVLYIHLYSALL